MPEASHSPADTPVVAAGGPVGPAGDGDEVKADEVKATATVDEVKADEVKATATVDEVKGGSVAEGPLRFAPLLGLFAAVVLVVCKTLAPVKHFTDEVIFRSALLGMRRGMGYYDAYQAALIGQDAAGSQVRSFRLPTQYLLLRPFPPSSWRWLAAAMVLASVLLCWRLARDSHPLAQAAVLIGSAVWLSELLDVVYLYAEIWALPWFLLALVAVRDERWPLAAVAVTAAVCFRELYLPALVFVALVTPRGSRRPVAVGALVVGTLGAVHWVLASDVLVAVGGEAPFAAFAAMADSVQSMLSPRPKQAHIALPMSVLTVLGAVGVARTWRVDKAALVAGATSVCLCGLTLFGGRIYWPLMFTPALVAFVGQAVPPRLAPTSR